jgi:hypothetical protein
LIVCACREKEYTARDAIDAAIFRGFRPILHMTMSG